MDKKPEDVESDVFRKCGPAEQLEESVEEGNQEADESGDIDGVKRFDEVGSRVIAAVIGPAVLEERMKMRISAEGELKTSFIRTRGKIEKKHTWKSLCKSNFQTDSLRTEDDSLHQLGTQLAQTCKR